MNACLSVSRFPQLALLSGCLALGARAQSDPRTETPWVCHVVDDSSRGADGVKLADINGDGLLDIATGWEEGGVTRVYLNPGPAEARTPWRRVEVGRTPGVEDAVFVDLDADGRYDVLSASQGGRALYVHWAPDSVEHILDAGQWRQERLPTAADRMAWIFSWPMNVDGRNGVDLVAGGSGPGAELGWFEAPEDPRDLAGFRYHTISPAGWIMSIWKSDMDADSDDDLVISDRRGPGRGCRWLENPGHGEAQTALWSSHMMASHRTEILSMDLADLDGDGLVDGIAAAKDKVILFIRRLDSSGKRWQTHPIGADFNCGKPRAVRVCDVNRDGRQDLVFTTWDARGKHGVLWLEYRECPMDRQWMSHPISGTEKGIKFDRIEMLDLDGDGDLDLLTCEEHEPGGGMGVIWYENPSAGQQADLRAD